MLEEGEASVETKRLKTDLTTMMGHIEVRLDTSFAMSFGDRSLLILSSLKNVLKVSKQCWQ